MAIFSLGFTEGSHSQARARDVRASISRALAVKNEARQDVALRRAVARLGGAVVVYDSRGRVLAQSAGASSGLTSPKVVAAARGAVRHGSAPKLRDVDLTVLSEGKR
ncbi:MAG TPA: hypothetical protein VM823_02060, partial [Gaiellales bacterium]|nr:hypothetical protein [Gaiellales bacterium]